MNLYKFNYRTNEGNLVLSVIANYENEALHTVLKARISKERGNISLKSKKELYDL
jgi:hypothetical protein